MFTDQRRALLSMLVGLAAIGLFSGFAAGADSSSNGLLAYDVTLTPNFITPNDPSSSNYQAVWLYGISPTTPYVSPDSYAHQGRYLLLDPRYTDSSGRAGRDDWWFIVQRYWPSSYQPSNHGNWGREVNFHNVAGDAGPGGGIGWSFGSGVSALALDWLPGQNAPQFTVETNHPNENQLLPPVSRDTWHTYVVHFVAGRTDGSTPRPGAISVWADGSDVPAINLSNIDTVQRAQGPDGNWYTQRWMQLWEGDYTQALATPSTVRLTLTRIGGSLDEAMNDRPALASTNVSGQFYSGSGTNAGAPSVRSIGALTANDGAIPLSLGGTGAGATASTTGATESTAPAAHITARPPTARSQSTGAIADSQTDESTTASVWWDGVRFTTWGKLKSHLVARGVEPNGFLAVHPTIASRLSLTSVQWDGRKFFLRGSFARWLRDRGQDYRGWAARHTTAAAQLTN